MCTHTHTLTHARTHARTHTHTHTETHTVAHAESPDTVAHITVCTCTRFFLTPAQSGGELRVDVDWYLSQQVHPVIARLCDPIEGATTSHASVSISPSC